MITPAGHFAHWHKLDRWLAQCTDLWQWVPFANPQPAWWQQRPALARYINKLTPAECDHFESANDDWVACLERVLPGVTAGVLPAKLENLTATAEALAEVRAADMPGRKRLQAGAFAGALAPVESSSVTTIVDWCCGKGHLARTLASAYGIPVTGLEWDKALVDDGNQIAQRYGDPVALKIQDVLAPDLCWPDHAHGVALHACGDLHRTLLRAASLNGAPRISVSPCCYALMTDKYAPMSTRVNSQRNRCVLGYSELRLAVQETVTAPARESRRRAQLNRWRLGFDGLQRDLRGVDKYLPVPPASSSLIQGDFRNFCAWAAQQKQLVLPEGLAYDHWEQHGEQRWQEVRRGELLRHVFRRPVEVCLVLDYVLYLEEQGYDVALGTFCARELTPRNILIDAKKRPQAPDSLI